MPLAPTVIVINDHEEEEVEIKIIKPEVLQPIEPKESANFSSKPVQEGFFDVFKHVPSIILLVVPTRARFKCMMQREGDDGREWFFCEGDPKISTN